MVTRRTLRCFAFLFSVTGPGFHALGDVPAFSGAEGFGAVTRGGAGGQVIHVTNLNDSGPGSFRAAVTASGPRTVVFDVAGQINLHSEVNVLNPYLTIAGETAPGAGVTIAGETVSLDIHDVIVRYMRFRRGYDISNPEPREDDALGSDRTNSNDLSEPKTGNIIIDHVSASWGLDENLSVYRSKLDQAIVPGGSTVLPSRNVTLQWSISSEALNPFRHAFGSTLGGAGVNQHHNLWASNTGRNPSISFSHFMDFRNNVLFNWMHRSVDGAGPEAHVNVINNYYRPGPATGFSNSVTPQPDPELLVRIVEPEIREGVFPGGVGEWYVDGNLIDGSVVGKDLSAVSDDNWEGLAEVDDGEFATGVQFEQNFPIDWARVATPHTLVTPPDDPDDPFDDNGSGGLGVGDPLSISLPTIATQSAADAYASVLAGAGASLVRDAVDLRVIESVTTGVATAGPRGDGIINHPDDVGGYPDIPSVARPADWDVDLDGMPGFWEGEHGLNPNDPSDGAMDFDDDGYTNLQDYLNEAGAFPAVEAIVWDNELGDGRYARIENWSIAFQPSRFDTAVIHSGDVTVDAVGQHAGKLRVAPEAGDSAALNIASGWLKVQDTLEIAAAGDNGVVNLSGGRLRVDSLTKGSGGSFNFTGGVLSAWEVEFSLDVQGGVVAPGDSTGETHVAGDLTLGGESGLEIQLAGAGDGDHDALAVDGAASLGGALDLWLLGEFTPDAQDEFVVLTAASLDGAFDNAPSGERLVTAGGGGSFLVSYGDSSAFPADQVVLSEFLAARPEGDYNGDGVVDARDYAVWRDTLGQSVLAGSGADGDGSGMVDAADYGVWRSHYGASAVGSLAPHSAAVPEPCACVALLVGVAALYGRRTQRLAR